MDPLTSITSTIALSMGLGWASGINLYAAIAMLGFMGYTGNMTLPPDLQVLANPMVITAAAGMYVVEFITDKIPGVDTGWDTIHTFIRIPAGAMLAAAAVGNVSPAVSIAAGIVGGGLAAGSHATKAGSRVIINTSPEPFSNWAASIGEDAMVFAGLWTSLHHPIVFLTLLVIFIFFAVWLLPKIWRGIKKVFAWLSRLFNQHDTPPASPPSTP